MSESPSLSAAPAAVSLLERELVLAAIAEPVREAILRALADGRPQSVNDVAARIGRPADGVSKHLRILREARLVRGVTPPDTDGRKQFYEVPALFRSSDTAGKPVLDFGAIALRFD